jgi:predicted permease
MDLLRTLLSRVAAVFQPHKLDRELDEELRVHIELAVAENHRRGMSPKEARREALRSFGGITQIREHYRTRRGLPMLEQLMRDLRFAARQLSRAPGFAFTAILTLALGLGANTAVFSLINGLLLRPLPVPHSEALTVLRYDQSDMERMSYFFTEPMFRAIQKRRSVFDSIAAFSRTSMVLRSGSSTVQIPGALVTGEFFTMLQTPPLLGRTLTPTDDSPGSAGVYAIVISEGFWRSWFQGAPDVLGRTLNIANQSFTVVGVMPKSFIGADPAQRPQIFANIQSEPVISAPYSSLKAGYHAWWLNILGRRRDGVSIDQANAAVAAASNAVLTESVPQAQEVEDARKNHFALGAEEGSKGFTYLRLAYRKPLMLVMALCSGVLLLACLNLASLLMARAAARQRELATRLALGASRRRLIQQLLMESLMIAAVGTLTGLAVSPLVSRALAVLLLGHQPDMQLDTTPDARVFVFAALLTALAAVLTGLLPALRATSGALHEQMKRGGQTKSGQDFGRERHRLLPRLLMSVEVALALLLVAGAGLLATSLTRLYRTGLGFDANGLINIDLAMGKQPLEGDALVRWYQQYAEALGHQPGVHGVSYQGITPLSGSMEAEDYHTPFSKADAEVYANSVAPDYFATMHIPLVAGREFRWGDTAAAGNKIILNETAAKVLFPGRTALGQIVSGSKDKAGKSRQYEVIAVVGDAKYLSIQDPPPATAYTSMTQTMDKKISYTAVVRLQGPAAPLADAARRLAQQMAPEIPAPALTTMASQLDDSISSQRMMAMLSVFFAVCALLVTAIGLYGTLAYSTARRTSEIGVRMALGAQRTQVVALIFRENAWVAVCGAGAGLGLALLAGRALASFLYGTSTRDPWVMAVSVLALMLVAGAASLLPALRAASLQPMEALRSE